MTSHDWKPITTAPLTGKFLIAEYAPTNWAYSITTVCLSRDNPRLREISLRYAAAWCEMLPEPPECCR